MQYQNWVHENGKTLLCTRIPGAGKTILSSIVIENIKTHIATNSPKEVRAVYLYCDYTDKKQSISQFLFTLLGQLLGTLPSLPESIRAMYHDNRPVLPSIDDLSKAPTHVTSSLTSDSHSRIFFVIDALDECTDRTRALLLTHLIRIQETSNVWLFLTTRPHIGCERFKDAMTLAIAAHDADIERYVDKCLFELCKDVQEDATLQKEVKSAIEEATGSMLVNMLWFCCGRLYLLTNHRFLLAKLHLESLKGRTNGGLVRESLRTLPKGYEEIDKAYDAVVTRIESQGGDWTVLAERALSWILLARRKITIFELQHALAVKIHHPGGCSS